MAWIRPSSSARSTEQFRALAVASSGDPSGFVRWIWGEFYPICWGKTEEKLRILAWTMVGFKGKRWENMMFWCCGWNLNLGKEFAMENGNGKPFIHLHSWVIFHGKLLNCQMVAWKLHDEAWDGMGLSIWRQKNHVDQNWSKKCLVQYNTTKLGGFKHSITFLSPPCRIIRSIFVAEKKLLAIQSVKRHLENMATLIFQKYSISWDLNCPNWLGSLLLHWGSWFKMKCIHLPGPKLDGLDENPSWWHLWTMKTPAKIF